MAAIIFCPQTTKEVRTSVHDMVSSKDDQVTAYSLNALEPMSTQFDSSSEYKQSLTDTEISRLPEIHCPFPFFCHQYKLK